MADNKIIEAYKDYYMLTKDINITIEIQVIKRKLHDILISRGLLFTEKERYTSTQNLKIFYGDSKLTSLKNIKKDKNKIVIVFENQENKETFLKKTMTGINEFDLSISVAITAQKLILLTLKELEDYV